jgi:hypothetical protein
MEICYALQAHKALSNYDEDHIIKKSEGMILRYIKDGL